MVASPRARNPWFIEIKRDLPQEIFCVIKDAVLSGISAFGVSVEDSVVKFNHKNRLYRDLSKFCGLTKSEIQNRLRKNFGARHKDFKAEVLVDNNKPLSLRNMPPVRNNRFAVGQYMKAKKKQMLDLVEQKVSLQSKVKSGQQQIRRLKAKVSS